MSTPQIRPRSSSEPLSTDDWQDVKIGLPGDLGLVRTFNGRTFQKCYYDADTKLWRNQWGEVVQVIKWKFEK